MFETSGDDLTLKCTSLLAKRFESVQVPESSAGYLFFSDKVVRMKQFVATTLAGRKKKRAGLAAAGLPKQR
jgi:hypothetical protein